MSRAGFARVKRAADGLAALTAGGSSLTMSVAGKPVFAAKDGKIVDPETKEPIVKDEPKRSNTVAGERLRSFVERVERLEEEKATIAGDIKEVYAEAKGEGFDAPTIRKIVRERKMDRAKREEQLELFDLYWDALGGAG